MKRTLYGVDEIRICIGPGNLEGAGDCQENIGEHIGYLWRNGSFIFQGIGGLFIHTEKIGFFLSPILVADSIYRLN